MSVLKLSAVSKDVHFDLELDGGEMVELKVAEFTINDLLKVVELQKPLFGDDSEKTLNLVELNKLMCTRIVCSVKYRKDNAYFWNIDNIDDFDFGQYPKELLNSISKLVDQVNPVVTNIEEEKKSS